MSAPTVGSVFSGGGLLDLGLHLAGFRHEWLCESDEFRRRLLRARFLGVPVFDDVRTLHGQAAADADIRRFTKSGTRDGQHRTRRKPDDGTGDSVARPVDLIAGGFPCKGASSAGKQNGFEHAETVLWHEMRRIIGDLQPRVVLIENVSNILGMAASPSEPAGSLWGTVLGDLAALGFDARWDCVPAAAVGAPHLRDRMFCVARHSDGARRSGGRESERAERGWAGNLPNEGSAAVATDADAAHGQGHGSAERVRAQVPGDHRNGAEPAADSPRVREGGAGTPAGTDGERARECSHVAVDWGAYAPAIHRWEAIHGTAPEPLVRRVDDGDPKLSRVRARVDRSEVRARRQRLSALGDGVHVYVAWLVGRYVMDLIAADSAVLPV